MATYITLDHASKVFAIPVTGLLNLCHSGNIDLHTLKPSGEQIMSEAALLEQLPIVSQPEYQQFAWMAGKGIGMREASNKYGIPHQTISRWVAAGWLPVIAEDGRKKLVDAAVMAYAAEIYKSNQGQGRWIFTANGVPYRRE